MICIINRTLIPNIRHHQTDTDQLALRLSLPFPPDVCDFVSPSQARHSPTCKHVCICSPTKTFEPRMAHAIDMPLPLMLCICINNFHWVSSISYAYLPRNHRNISPPSQEPNLGEIIRGRYMWYRTQPSTPLEITELPPPKKTPRSKMVGRSRTVRWKEEPQRTQGPVP